MPPQQFATLSVVQAAILHMMNGYEPAFWAIGIHLFQAFATIRLVWRGVEIMFGHRHHVGAFMYAFIELILLLSFGYAMITFYGSPIPGIGMSFSEIVPSMAQYCANLLDARALEQTFHHLDVMAAKFIAPSVFVILGNLLYWTLLIALAITKLVALFVVLFPLLGVATLVLLGGLFVPFFIVPQLDWIFWGWLKSIMSLSFQQVVVFAYLMVVSRFLDALVLTMPETIDLSQYPLYVVEVLALVGAMAAGAVVIPPKVCGMLFGGQPPTMKVPGL